MSGETDLAAMLASLEVLRRPGVFAYAETASATGIELGDGIEAVLNDGDSVTVIGTPAALAEGGLSPEFEAAWLTLAVHSALEAVGLTAAFSAALGEADVPCNVIAGLRHDHILVPVDKVDTALTALAQLRDSQST